MRIYTNGLNEVTGAEPPYDCKDFAEAGYAERTEFCVSDATKTFILDYVPMSSKPVIVEFEGIDKKTVIPWNEIPNANQVAICFETGKIKFGVQNQNQSVTYTPYGTAVNAALLNTVQKRASGTQGWSGSFTIPNTATLTIQNGLITSAAFPA